MVVLGQTIGLAVDPANKRHLVIAVDSQKGIQVDAKDDLTVLAQPVAGDQLHLAGLGIGKGRVVDDQQTGGLLFVEIPEIVH